MYTFHIRNFKLHTSNLNKQVTTAAVAAAATSTTTTTTTTAAAAAATKTQVLPKYFSQVKRGTECD
jgi:uncharacterized protein YccT (UPF0319 family)